MLSINNSIPFLFSFKLVMSSRGIQFDINPALYIKDPQMSTFGQKLISNSIQLMEELGFEKFTFKKLANQISSTETSIYRYFENKHKLLLWLTSWYWEWVNYLIDINTMNIECDSKRLEIIIHNIVNASTESPITAYINENILHKVIISESSKAYHVINVDDENNRDYFSSYNELINKVETAVLSVNSDYPYPKMLASNLFEMANNQIYFAVHLPKLTDIKSGKKMYEDLEKALIFQAMKLLN